MVLIEPALWQRIMDAGLKAVIATMGVVVTTWIVDTGPLQPVTVALIVVIPLQPAA